MQVPALREVIRSVLWPLDKLFAGKYFVDELFDRIVIRPTRTISRFTFRMLDQTLVEGSGNAIGSVSRAVGGITCRLTTGQVATYVLLMFMAVSFFFGVFIQAR